MREPNIVANVQNADSQHIAQPIQSKPLDVGEMIPDVDLLDIDGSNINLRQLVQQHVTALIFYQGEWCPWCKAQITTFWRYYDEILAAGLKVVFISVDPPDVSKAYKKRLEDAGVTLPKTKQRSNAIPFLILCDPDRRATNMFGISRQSRERGILSKPSAFIANKEGVMRFVHIGQDYADRLSHYRLIAAAKAAL